MRMKQQKTMTRMLQTITVTHKNTLSVPSGALLPQPGLPQWLHTWHSAAHAVSPPRVHRPPDPSGPMTLPVMPASRRQWRHRITAIPSRVRRSGETMSSSRRLAHCVWFVSCWFDCCLACELFDCRLWVVCLIAVCELFVWLTFVSCLIGARG